MRVSKLWMTGLCLLMVSVSPSLAGIGKGNGELGFDFGVTAFDDDLTGGSGEMLKLRGGYFITGWFEVEGQVAYSEHFDLSSGDDASSGGDKKMTQYFLSGVFNFPSKGGNIVPYLLAGVGSTSIKFPGSDFDDDSTAWQAALGTRFFFGDRDQVAFRIEIAFLLDDAFEQSNRHEQYAVGFTWRLGGGA